MQRRSPCNSGPSKKFNLVLATIMVIAVYATMFTFIAPKLSAQTDASAAPNLPSFEVASIKRDPRGCGGCAIRFDGGDPSRYTAINVTAKWLIELAYGIKDFQLSGGPSWTNSLGFDIDAKVDDATANHIAHLPRDQQQARKNLMVRSLLAERFNLKITRGTTDVSGYAMVVAKGGPKITEVPPPPPPGTLPTPAPPPARGGDGLFPLHPGQRDISTTLNGVRTIRGNTEPLSELASMLSTVLGHPVLDQTEMKGSYDFKLQFAAETGIGGAPPPPAGQGTSEENTPSLFSAIQEQLGLRLESTKAPVETIVIDHIDEPSEN